MSEPKPVRISMTAETLDALDDAVSYWLSAAGNNYGAGYQRGDPNDAEERRKHRLMAQLAKRLAIHRERSWS